MPERVNATYARDLIRRARRGGFIDSTQRPFAFDAGRAGPIPDTRRLGSETERSERRKLPVTVQELRLRQAERGVVREIAELGVLRTAPDLEHNDPRRRAYMKRFYILAAKGRRRAEFRNGEFTEMRSQRQAGLSVRH